MKNKKIRYELEQGNCVFGTMLTNSVSPRWAGHFANIGLDYVVIDTEHSPFNRSEVANLINSFNLGNVCPIVRIPIPSAHYATMHLDAGAGGVIVPMLEKAEQLKAIIEQCAWPPKGKRGVGFSRANLFGKYFEHYKIEAQSPVVVAQIENIRAVEALENILMVPGLDAILIGPYDLTASMGMTGQFEAQEYINILSKIKKLSQKFNIPLGIHVVQPDSSELKARISEGYQFIAYSIDSVFLYCGAECPNLK